MIKFLTATAALGLLLGVAACSEKSEDLTSIVNHKGSVETGIQVEDLDASRKVLVTTHKVWVRDTVYRTLVYRDTLPALGTMTTEAENEDGDTKTVSVERDYEIYITVK
ncbi:hypothetical protein [Flaviaesturariibacter amylovorans]|uniref:Uncharacterized protein n=1 Tax=Flaviaesturariibacter amylovorans TaxID=1084520 RepID=A0ABP8HSX3_9BACT